MAKYDYLLKFLVIGDAAVGKTALLVRFCDNNYNGSYQMTIGIDFKVQTVEVEGKRLKLQVWDTAGQERFRNITHAFYRGAHAVILVYDVTSRKSFLNVKEWSASIKQFAQQDVQVLLVGTKTDLADKRVVTTDEGKAYAEENKMPFFETSALTGHNVQAAFEHLALLTKHQYIDKVDVKKEEPGGLDLSREAPPAASSSCC